MGNGDIEYSDESDYSKEQKYSIKEIILRHIRKISDLSCKEFTGGYWEKKPIRTSTGIMFSEVYHGDVREAYCNAIDFLIDLIYSMSDETLKKYLEDYENYTVYEKDKEGKENKNFREEKKKEEGKEDKKETVKEKLRLKRITFRQINIMFKRMDFWKGVESYNE